MTEVSLGERTAPRMRRGFRRTQIVVIDTRDLKLEAFRASFFFRSFARYQVRQAYVLYRRNCLIPQSLKPNCDRYDRAKDRNLISLASGFL